MVHFFTASGVLAGVLALDAAWAHNQQAAFLWMMIAVFIDSVDGTFARRCQVERYAPHIDGRRLDDMVDYFTWVIVPIFSMSLWGWLPPLLWAVPLMCSALGMAHMQAKTDDNYFLGFPSLWNIVALYLWHWQLPPGLNGAIVMVLSLTVLLPLRFIYPTKTPHWRLFNMLMMSLWGILVVISLGSRAPWAERCFWWSNLFPIYYLAMSFWLHCQDKPENTRRGQDPREEPEHER